MISNDDVTVSYYRTDPNERVTMLVNGLRQRRMRGETSNPDMVRELGSLERNLKNKDVCDELKVQGFHALAAQNPHNEHYATQFAQSVTAFTPTTLISEAYALGLKASQDEKSAAYASPLEREMEKTIGGLLASGYYRQNTAQEFMGDIGQTAKHYGAAVPDETMQRFATISTETQLNRFTLTKKSVTCNDKVQSLALWLVGAYDATCVEKLTPKGMRSPRPGPGPEAAGRAT